MDICQLWSERKMKETRIGGTIRVPGRRVGGPALHNTSRGSTHYGRAGTVGNGRGRRQGVRRGRATGYLMHGDFRRSGLAGTLAVGLGEPNDDGERGRRKSNIAGGYGGHRSILGGAAPACEPYSARMFPDDVLECFRTVSLLPSTSPRTGREQALEQRFGAHLGVCGCRPIGGLLLPARVVKAMARARIKLERNVAAERAAALNELPAALRRRLLIGGAMEGKHRCIGPIALCVEMSAQATTGVEHERGAEAKARAVRCIDRHGGERC